MARVVEMFVLDVISAIEFGDGELRIDFADGAVDRYRVRDGQLEFFTRRSDNPAWYPLSPEEVLQHVVLRTPVATWLYVRLRLKVASEIRKQFEDLGGRAMVTDPVCGTEIEEIDVPECLRSECGGKIYYFCSLECKSEFEQNRKRFVEAA
jgi:YHS domain-containing protein